MPCASNCGTLDASGRIIFGDAAGDIWRVDMSAGTLVELGLAHYHGGICCATIPVVDASGNVWALSQDAAKTRNYITFTDRTTTDYLLKSGDDTGGNSILSGGGLIQAAIYNASDNTIIFGTDTGLYNMEHRVELVVASLAQPTAGMSQWIDANGLFVNGVSKIDAATLTVVAALNLSDYTLPHPGDPQALFHQYDAASDAAFLMDNCGNVQQLSLASTSSGIHDIDGDANPALAIYDLLTHPIYGLRKSSAKIDADSFDYAARILANEGLGSSMNIDTPNDADSIISDMFSRSTKSSKLPTSRAAPGTRRLTK
jgi:hypothetical protein